MRAAKPQVSVIVPTAGRSEITIACAALRGQTFQDFETIVADDASENGTVKLVRAEFPEVQVVEHAEQVFSASGTACLWRTSAFRALGGFDESFFAYYEDVDLGFRARLAGFECWYAPRAVALHEGGATTGADWAQFEALHAVRNR